MTGVGGPSLIQGAFPVSLFLGFVTIVYTHRRVYKKSSKDDADDSQQQQDIHVAPKSVLELIQRRRSIFPKQYTGNTVPTHIINDMLEAARWAPTHRLTEPWYFVVFETPDGRQELGQLMANHYKASTDSTKFLQTKYDKKIRSARQASQIIAICMKVHDKNPVVEEVCSVAMAIQNMHLVATAHGIGAYWSSGGIYDTELDDSSSSMIVNPRSLQEFLEFVPTNDDNNINSTSTPTHVCLGWLYVGEFNDENASKKKKWPDGRRRPLSDNSVKRR
eukprot:scaffold154822_cov51-Attheya_sp.AAC.3